jgi:hypothetical protein
MLEHVNPEAWYDADEAEPLVSRVETQFEQTGDFVEFPRDEEKEACAIIERHEGLPVTKLLALPDDPLADWRADFADGHAVLFWVDPERMATGSRLHIVERLPWGSDVYTQADLERDLISDHRDSSEAVWLDMNADRDPEF